MKKIYLFLSISLCAACTKVQPQEVELVALGGKPKSIEVAATVDTCTFELISNVDYKAQIVQGGNWASFLDDSMEMEGSGNGTIQVKVNANTGIKRVAKVVVEHSTRSDTLLVLQNCLPEYEETIVLETKSVIIPPEGGSAQIAYTSNVPDHLITTFAYSDRILNLVKDKGNVLFEVDANDTYNPLNTKVTLTFINGWEQKQVAEISVFQNFLAGDPEPPSDASFTIGTYNLWAVSARLSEYDNKKASVDRIWENSKKVVSQCIADMNLDILALQEVDTRMINDVTSYLKGNGMGYSSIFFYPDEANHDKQSADGILYKSSRFDLVSTFRYWISPTPLEQSYGWDEGAEPGPTFQYRYKDAVYYCFYDKFSSRNFIVTAIHGPQYPKARSHSSELMINYEKTLNTDRYPAFFIGDMNADDAVPSDPFLLQMREYCQDSYDVAAVKKGQRFTFAGSSTDAAPYKRLDYIFMHSDNANAFDVEEHTVNEDKYKVNSTYYYPSDHLPVYIKVKLK